jgi:gentisate 1,2-dioxygenase
MNIQIQERGINDLDVIIEKLDHLNEEARAKDLWIRTKWNLANQKAWHLGECGSPTPSRNNLPLEHKTPVAHVWKWADIEPYLMTLSRLCPLELTERQSVLLTNPAYGLTGVKVTNTIRIAISIYKQGDVAQPHLHTPNASRTIISEGGGYTVVEGEKIPAHRGDLVFTPNGTWHGHGNLDPEPVIWADTLDWPLMDFLGCVSTRSDPENAPDHGEPSSDFSTRFYGRGGIKPLFEACPRGSGKNVTPRFLYRAGDIRGALDDMSSYDGDPYEGIHVEIVNPMNGASVFPTVGYRAQLLKSGQSTAPYRHSASQVYFVLEGSGYTDVNGQRLEWSKNDFFVVPSHSWRSHTVTGCQAILYSYTDAPLIERVGMYRAQGKLPSGKIVELA